MKVTSPGLDGWRINELKALPPLPICFGGDLNADIEGLPAVQNMIVEGWTDLGHNAHWWGGPT